MAPFRIIPAVDQIVDRPALADLIAAHGRDAVVEAARRSTAVLRALMQQDAGRAPGTPDLVGRWLDEAIAADFGTRLAVSLRPVINATGVVLHTNLGRAPIARDALARAAAIGSGYSNLEYSLDSGTRGRRHIHAERLLCHLTGAAAGFAVNNNAAATLLVLAALAHGREVIVSRGELVEIGGGFRVPDVMAQSGAVLREVGTTNRTRVADYASAIGDRTALLLRVHPSNFRVEGFTERPALDELVALGRRFDLPLFEDLGSGWLGLDGLTPSALADEPSVAASVRAGVDLVAFSGDKLLGGPQAGLVVGRADLVNRVASHPLMRAVRAGKLTFAALEATLDAWTRPAARARLPVVAMLTVTIDRLDARARAVQRVIAAVPGLTVRLADGFSAVGGGSAPGSALPTRLLAVALGGTTAATLEARLRSGQPPVIARIERDEVVLDLRTVAESEDPALTEALARASSEDRRH